MGSDLVHAAGDGETLNKSPLWPFLARGHAAQKPKRGAAWATAGKTGLAHANAGGGKGGRAVRRSTRSPTEATHVRWPGSVCEWRAVAWRSPIREQWQHFWR